VRQLVENWREMHESRLNPNETGKEGVRAEGLKAESSPQPSVISTPLDRRLALAG
jgi:hypothetical protein